MNPAALRLAVLAGLGLSSAAWAQNDATPLIPNLDGFSLPATRPSVLPTPEPSPTASATPVPAETSAPRPAPRTARPTPSPTARPRPSATATPAATSPVSEPTPAVTPDAAPAILPVPQATPTPSADPTPAATPAAVPAGAEDQPGHRFVWLALGLATLAALAFAVLRRRRSHEIFDDVTDTIEPVRDDPTPSPVAAPVTDIATVQPEAVVPDALPNSAAAVAAAPEPDGRAQIGVEMRTVRAGTNLTGGAVNYEITLHNSGATSANDVRVDIRLMNASVDQDEVLKALFSHFIDKPIVARFDLAAGQSITLGGMAMMPGEALVPLTIEGRAFFVPVFAVNVLYRWGPTHHGQSAKAWLIGIEREPGAKMAPFRLDTGPRMYDTVGQRLHGLGIIR